MVRHRWVYALAVMVALSGCADASTPQQSAEDRARQNQQARDALARYEQAVQLAGGAPAFVPVGDPIGQVGTWEPDNTAYGKALSAGTLNFTPLELSITQPPATGTVTWPGGASEQVQVLMPSEALARVTATAGGCDGCPLVDVTGVRLATATVATMRGPATAPVWELTLKGTAVRATLLAGLSRLAMTPPTYDAFGPSVGGRIEAAATTTGSTQLRVWFTGAPKSCNVDYTGEVVESAHAVVAFFVEHPHKLAWDCTNVGVTTMTTVELAQPLGERAVLEVTLGQPVPVRVRN
jgi:hypothetical protein